MSCLFLLPEAELTGISAVTTGTDEQETPTICNFKDKRAVQHSARFWAGLIWCKFISENIFSELELTGRPAEPLCRSVKKKTHHTALLQCPVPHSPPHWCFPFPRRSGWPLRLFLSISQSCDSCIIIVLIIKLTKQLHPFIIDFVKYIIQNTMHFWKIKKWAYNCTTNFSKCPSQNTTILYALGQKGRLSIFSHASGVAQYFNISTIWWIAMKFSSWPTEDESWWDPLTYLPAPPSAQHCNFHNISHQPQLYSVPIMLRQC